MINSRSTYAVLYALVCCSFAYADTATLTITGRVAAPTCGTVTVNNGKPVDFGEVNIPLLKKNGFTTPINFFITFSDCHSEVHDRIRIAFQAVTVPHSEGYAIALDSTQNTAKGVAIEMKDSGGNRIKFDETMNYANFYNLNDGQTDLGFKAFLVPERINWDNLQPGKIKAKATFIAEYL